MKLRPYKLYFTLAISIAIWALLLWDHFHGGVPSHHLLHRADLPKISNWWSGLIIPALTLLLTYRIERRLIHSDDQKQSFLNILYPFLFALIYGILISVFFLMGYSKITGYLFNGIVLLALFFPIYRAEYLLGFVIGITPTFGAFLSTVAGTILVIVGLLIYLFVRKGIWLVFKKNQVVDRYLAQNHCGSVIVVRICSTNCS
jgi:hypothetical protein